MAPSADKATNAHLSSGQRDHLRDRLASPNFTIVRRAPFPLRCPSRFHCFAHCKCTSLHVNLPFVPPKPVIEIAISAFQLRPKGNRDGLHSTTATFVLCVRQIMVGTARKSPFTCHAIDVNRINFPTVPIVEKLGKSAVHPWRLGPHYLHHSLDHPFAHATKYSKPS